MAKVVFVNPDRIECGVFQLGVVLHGILQESLGSRYFLMPMADKDAIQNLVHEMGCDVVIWNWHPTIDSYLSDGPPKDWPCKHILLKHEPTPHEDLYDRVIFSDPTAEDYDNVRHIGRPLPLWHTNGDQCLGDGIINVGLHGFVGAQAITMMETLRFTHDLSKMNFRLHLPHSPYVDPEGILALKEADSVRDTVREYGGTVEARHDFMPMDELIDWLSRNDVNCYVRQKISSVGVSSALDAALVCGKPIAINKCEAFRHFWGCEPSICLEDRSLHDIIGAGDYPVKPLRAKWSRESVLRQVEEIISEVVT